MYLIGSQRSVSGAARTELWSSFQRTNVYTGGGAGGGAADFVCATSTDAKARRMANASGIFICGAGPSRVVRSWQQRLFEARLSDGFVQLLFRLSARSF